MDTVRVVEEVEHEHIGFPAMGSIEARQRLHGQDAGKRLVDVHRLKQRFVIPRLELVRTHEDPVRVFLYPRSDLT